MGPGDRHIATFDADGVALAAIQGLIAENEVLKARLDRLERWLGEEADHRGDQQ